MHNDFNAETGSIYMNDTILIKIRFIQSQFWFPDSFQKI